MVGPVGSRTDVGLCPRGAGALLGMAGATQRAVSGRAVRETEAWVRDLSPSCLAKRHHEDRPPQPSGGVWGAGEPGEGSVWLFHRPCSISHWRG